MIENLAFFFTLNLLAATFYACYGMKTSPIYKDKIKALYYTTIVLFFGMPLILVHLFTKGKQNEK